MQSGNTDCKISNFLPCTDPASQNNTSSSAFSFNTSNPCVNDENNALIATPANVNLRGVVPSFPKELEANTSTAAIAAPKKAIHVKADNDVTEKITIATTMKKAAPEFNPIKSGEACGFFVKVCIRQPAMAKLAPTLAAINALGRRTF